MPSCRRCAVLLLAAAVACGCSSSRRGATQAGPGRSDELREVAGMLALYGGEFGRGPTRPADLARYEAGYQLGYEAVQSGAVVIVPGATMPGEGEKTGTKAIVAYEKDAPTQGGLVLLHDGTVKKMSADEFRSAAKFGH